MTDRAQRELSTLQELWSRERAATRARFAEEREHRTLRERVERGHAAIDLWVDDVDAMVGGRTLLWLSPGSGGSLEELRVRTGEPVVLWFDDPGDEDAVHAIVSRKKGDRLAVVLDSELPERLEDGGFRLDREAPQATFDRGERAIARFAEAPSKHALGHLREVLFGDARPAATELEPLTFFDGDLEEQQRLAVRRAFASTDIALVHGPPGTGKTRTLVEVVRQELGRGHRVLVSAASNAAVDNIAERLADVGVPLVRLGHPARVAEAVLARTLDALVDGTPEQKLARRWQGEANALRKKASRSGARGPERQERRALFADARRLMRDARGQLAGLRARILERHPVVCATAAGADSRLLGDEHFDLVVLDEATQAPDPLALVALGRAPRAVLAGDPRQLPPTVIDSQAEREGLGRTLFERVGERHAEALTLLEIQHRMHAALMRFPSASMYEHRLVAAPAAAARDLGTLSGVLADPLRPGPLVFIDTAGKGWEEQRTQEDPSTRNPDQAARVVLEVMRFLARGVAPEDIAVITPYEAQARLLRGGLADARGRGLEVGTIDGFQGREKEVVVVDLVRSNDEGALGFLADTRRMNVALTRARRALLVVGDSATLATHRFYRAFIEDAENTGAALSAWADDARGGLDVEEGQG